MNLKIFHKYKYWIEYVSNYWILLQSACHAYPCRLSDIIPRFGRQVVVTNQVLDYLYGTHSHMITQWNHQILSQFLLQLYSDAIAAQRSALKNCFGFVDRTVFPICKPAEHQSSLQRPQKSTRFVLCLFFRRRKAWCSHAGRLKTL